MQTATPNGKLARSVGLSLRLRVLQSRAGYYIGTADDEGPVSRESLEYWPTQAQADKALSEGVGEGYTQHTYDL